ncbi:MAG: ATP-binding protein [Planctomycetota bacterium]|nr:ATP-binding protein [Planctomycetota bacterium]
MNHSLKTRLLIGTVVGMAAIPLIIGAIIYSIVNRSLLDSFDKNLHSSSKNLYSRVHQQNGRIHAEWDAANLSNYQIGQHPDYFQLYTNDGQVVARSPSLGQGTLSPIDMSQGNLAYQNLTLPNGQNGRLICLEFLPHFDPDNDEEENGDFFENEEEMNAFPKPKHDRRDNDEHDEDDEDDEDEDDEDEDERNTNEDRAEDHLEELDREFREFSNYHEILAERIDYLAGVMHRLAEREKAQKNDQNIARDLLIQRVGEEVKLASLSLNELENRHEEWERLEEKHDEGDFIDRKEAFIEGFKKQTKTVTALIQGATRALRNLMKEHRQLFSHLKNQRQEPLILIVARESTELQSQLRLLQILLLSGALATVLLAFGVGYTVVNRGLRPLNQLAKEIEGIHSRSLGERIELAGLPVEMLPVGERLNQLLDRLQEAFQRERRFSADVAHELRTPIAGLLSLIEVTAMRKRKEEEYKETLDDCFEISQGMQKVVSSLLLLDKLETRQIPMVPQSCSSRELIEKSWVAFSEQAQTKELQFTNHIAPTHSLDADPEILRMVISNLLSNAVEHTDHRGSLEISERGPHGLSFRNSGCQLSQVSVERVFDRFWRGDCARGQTGQHSGLGLALVQRAISALGGQVEARLSGKDGFVIEIILPPTRTNASW